MHIYIYSQSFVVITPTRTRLAFHIMIIIIIIPQIGDVEIWIRKLLLTVVFLGPLLLLSCCWLRLFRPDDCPDLCVVFL